VEVWRYHLREIAGGRWIYDHEYPMPPADPVVGPLVEYTLAVLDALEIRNSAAHTEVMVTRNGPILVESGARLGGSHLPEVVSRCLGTDQVERLALAIARPEEITERRLAPYQLLTHLRYVSLISPGEGVVPTAERFAPVRQLSSFLDVVFTLPEGKPIMRTVDLASSPGYVYLSSNHPQQVEEDYARLRHYELNGLYDP